MKIGKKIFEIIFHARGGQGAKTAAELLAQAALAEGKFVQAFPDFGPERTGAPMKTSCGFPTSQF
jgi:pyruvate ferredoxin oxidoreductase gamma subunit